MRKLIFALLAVLISSPVFALSANDTGKAMFNPTVVTSGAAWTSSAVDLSRVREFEVFIDNTSGLAFRDLTMNSYSDPKCVTTVDSVVLRRVGFGAAPTGSSYAPGRVRGYVGPNPPGATSGVHTLIDTTGASGASIDTGVLFLEESDQVFFRIYNSGAGASGLAAVYETDDASATGTAIGSVANVGAGAEARFAWGPGTAGWNSSAAAGVTRSGKVLVTGAVNAIVRVRVVSRGRIPGTFSHQMALPPCAKLSLSAASGPVQVYGVAH